MHLRWVRAVAVCTAWTLLAVSPYATLVVRIDATTSIALTLVSASGGCTLTNAGTNWAALDLGEATSSSATSCATYSRGKTYELATPIGVEATCSGTCTSWKLGIKLASAAQGGTTWEIGSHTLTTTTYNVSGNKTYGSIVSETLTLSVKTNGGSPAPATIQQAIDFTATANGVTGVTSTATLNVESINAPGLSIYFVSDPSGAAIAGGAFAAGLNFGTVQAYGGTLAPGVTRTSVTASNYTLQTYVDVDVEESGVASRNYTMQASLQSAAPAGLQYAVNGVTLTTSAQTVTTTGTYGSDEPYALDLIVSSAGPAAGGPAVGSALSDTLEFAATAN